MDAEEEKSLEAEGLRLVRAFLSLPPEKRAEALTFVEALVQTTAGTEPEAMASAG